MAAAAAACLSDGDGLRSRGQVAAGKYLQYFGVMGVSLLVIVLLHFTLKHKERLKKLRENDEELPQRSRKEGNEEK